jgi:hypothetical protein
MVWVIKNNESGVSKGDVWWRGRRNGVTRNGFMAYNVPESVQMRSSYTGSGHTEDEDRLHRDVSPERFEKW